jgi:hypothetical protein
VTGNAVVGKFVVGRFVLPMDCWRSGDVLGALVGIGNPSRSLLTSGISNPDTVCCLGVLICNGIVVLDEDCVTDLDESNSGLD